MAAASLVRHVRSNAHGPGIGGRGISDWFSYGSVDMDRIVISSLQVLAGLCLYATIIHLTHAMLAHRGRRLHLLFSVTALAASAYALSEVAVYRASDPTHLLTLVRLNLALVMILFLGFVWSITAYTRIGSRRVLLILSAAIASLFIINLIAPYTLQYAAMPTVNHIRLPWGETLSLPRGPNGHWFALAALTHFFVLGYIWVALVLAYLRDRNGGTLALLAAVAGLTAASIEGVLVRTGHIRFIHLGGIGVLIMVLAMTVVLFYDTTEEIHASERRFRSLIEQSPFSIHVLAPDGRTRQVNAAWEKLWNRTFGSMRDYNVFQDAQLVDAGLTPHIQAALAGRPQAVPAIPYSRPEAGNSAAHRDYWIRTYVYPITDARGTVRDVILMHEDVTESKRIEDAFRLIAAGVSAGTGEQFFQELTRSLAQVFETDHAIIAALDPKSPGYLDTLAVWSHGSLAGNLRYPFADTPCARVVGGGLCLYTSGVRRQFPDSRMLLDFEAEAYAGVALRDVDGTPLGVLAVINGRPVHSLKPVQDILQIFAARASAELVRRRAERRLHDMAYHDHLTGLANRARLLEMLAVARANAQQTETHAALISVDLDHFKTINDSLGHDVGDHVLRAVAQRLQKGIGKEMQVARLGGDEFAVLIDTGNRDRAQARSHVERAAQQLMQQLATPIHVEERSFIVGASMGVVLFCREADTEQALLRHAEMALYRAKHLGRDNIQFYMARMQDVADDRLRVEVGLRQVLTRNELALHLQPQIDDTGHLVGAEALLRWTHPELGDISPADFIPVAEETGLIHAIGHWVYEQACQYVKAWELEHRPFGRHLSVNVSPWQFIRPDFVQQIVDTVHAYQVDPRYLMLELTETGLLMDLDDAIHKLRELRNHGFQIALDDFGTGYSSLAYLKDLPLDQIKIDKTFVGQLNPKSDNPLVRSMVSIGQHMNLSVVAEGVETAEQRTILLDMGCRMFQGYFFHRPMTAQAFEEWASRCAQPSGRCPA